MDGTAALAALGLLPGASLAQIKAAYRRAVKHVHPDHAGSTDAFLALHEAYQRAEAFAEQPPLVTAPIPLTAPHRAPPTSGRWFQTRPDRRSTVDLIDVRRPSRQVPHFPTDNFEAHLAFALAGL